MEQREFDVVIATDCRLPGGTAASVAEEVTAQWSAGLRTALLHVPSHLVAGDRPFNERLRGCVLDDRAEPLIGTDQLRCRLLVVRQPQVFAEPITEPTPTIEAAHRLMVANHTPADRSGRRRFYDPQEVTVALERHLGGDDWIWAPIGPNVRESLEAETWTPPMLDEDWVNVIDVDRWEFDRSAPRTDPIVIGRHGRDLWDKWPADADVLLDAYPERPGFEVRVLGGAETAELMLGRRPANWIVHPYGTVRPEDFLAGIDFFVYYPHPDSIEAFGRTVLEALASGAVAVLPDRFRRLFGDAALYRAPGDVVSTLQELAADPAGVTEAVERGRTAARERFSHEAHLRRLEPFIDRPIPAERRRPAIQPPVPPQRPPATAGQPTRTGSGPLTTIRHRLRRMLGTLVRIAKTVYAALPDGAKRRLQPLVRAAPASLTRRGERAGWGSGERPTVMFVLPEQADLTSVTERIVRLETMTAAFHPLAVVISGDPAALRDRGIAVERWDGNDIDALVTRHRPVHTLCVDADGRPLDEPWLVDLLIALRSR